LLVVENIKAQSQARKAEAELKALEKKLEAVKKIFSAPSTTTNTPH